MLLSRARRFTEEALKHLMELHPNKFHLAAPVSTDSRLLMAIIKNGVPLNMLYNCNLTG